MDNRRRVVELEIKEQAIQQKAEGERDLRALREEIHERQRQLDKRQDGLEQQAEQLRKQEKTVEGTQRKLTEKIQEVSHRKEELTKLLDLQRQTLHEISGLSAEEATRRLMALLETQVAAGERRDPDAAPASPGGGLRREIPRAAVDLPAPLRGQSYRGDHHQQRRHPQRRDERPDHRPRGSQHPRLREGHRRGRDHRRHARRGDRQRLRHHPPRGRPARAQQADRRRADPSLADRGARGRYAEGAGAARPEARRGGLPGSLRTRVARTAGEPAGPAPVPHQLQPERAAALDRGGLFGRDAGRRDGLRRQPWPAAAACCTTSARRPTTRRKAAIRRSAPNS